MSRTHDTYCVALASAPFRHSSRQVTITPFSSPTTRPPLTPSQRWDFPSKQNPAYKNPALVARLQQLWEQNYTQKDMVDTLQTEGYQINEDRKSVV